MFLKKIGIFLSLGFCLVQSANAGESKCPKEKRKIAELEAKIAQLESILPNYLCEAICLLPGYTASNDKSLIILSNVSATYHPISSKDRNNKVAFDNLKTECAEGQLLSKEAYVEMESPRGVQRGLYITRLPSIEYDCKKSD